MLQRLQKQKRTIICATSNLTMLQWEHIDLLVDALNIFNQAAFAASSSKVTVSETIPIENSVVSEFKSHQKVDWELRQ